MKKTVFFALILTSLLSFTTVYAKDSLSFSVRFSQGRSDMVLQASGWVEGKWVPFTQRIRVGEAPIFSPFPGMTKLKIEHVGWVWNTTVYEGGIKSLTCESELTPEGAYTAVKC